jgi:hypothetical protein
MSTKSADATPGPSALGVIGIAFGLMLIAALAAFLIFKRAKPIDGAAALAQRFGVRSLPFGLEVTRGDQLSSGEQMIVLENPAAPPEPAASERAADAPKLDWTKLELGTPGAPPQSVVVLLSDAPFSRERDAELFGRVEFRDVKSLDDMGGVLPIAAGKVGWCGYDASFVHERNYEKSGTFRDALRVNLSVQGKTAILTAKWPRGAQASKQTLEQLLAPLKAL